MNHLKRLLPVISLVILAGALVLLWHELEHLDYRQIRVALHELKAWRIGLAVLLTVCNYAVLVGYDYLAIRSVGRKIPLYAIAVSSFVGFTTSYNFSSLLGGPAIRYRFYSRWELTPAQLAQVLVMIGVTFWLGAVALASIMFLVVDLPLPAVLHLPLSSTRWLGGLLLVVILGYLCFVRYGWREWSVGGNRIPRPSMRLSLSQLGIAACDLCIAAGAMYALIGHELHCSYPTFLTIYLLATLATVVTNVPGGVGVFELVFIAYAPDHASPELIAALLLFRVIYYLLPLGASMLILGGYEVYPYRSRLNQAFRISRVGWSSVVPYVFATACFVSGTALLLSGATPSMRERMEWLLTIVPRPLLEVSHFLGSIVGACLLLLSRGLIRRLDSAYWMTCGLLACGIVFSLLKGFDFEEALLLVIVLACLIPFRDVFYREGSTIGQAFTLPWWLAVTTVMLCVVWLGLFSFRHAEYVNWDWWALLFSKDAPSAVRATAGATMAFIILVTLKYLSPEAPTLPTATPEDLSDASKVIASSALTVGNLALLGDKSLLFNANRTAFVMYARQGRSWVCMGDPVGPHDAIPQMVYAFRELVDRYAGWPVFYQVAPEHVTAYLDQGLTLLKLGEDAQVDLAKFGVEGSHHKGLRQTLNRMERENVTFEILEPVQVTEVLPQLELISDAWLAEKQSREKGFSLGYFSRDYMRRFPCAIARQGDRIVAFANVWQAGNHQELSIDLMRYDPRISSGVMEYLLIKLMLWGKEQHYKNFNLGMAPLSGLDSKRLSPLWNRALNLFFTHGNKFYRFEGLRQYKEKFDPVWSSRYLAIPGRVSTPRILADLTQLIRRHREDEP